MVSITPPELIVKRPGLSYRQTLAACVFVRGDSGSA